MLLDAPTTQLIFAAGLVICPGFYTAPYPPPEALGSPKYLSPCPPTPPGPQHRELGPDFAHPEDWVWILPTTRFGRCLDQRCGCPSPDLEGAQQGRAHPGSCLGQSLGRGGLQRSSPAAVVPKHKGVLPQTSPFPEAPLPTLAPSGLPGPRRRSPGPRPEPLSSRRPRVCVTACKAWAGHANSVEAYAHQITPLKRLRVGKESPAKHRRPEAGRLLTCTASRGPAGCGGPRFIFYKGGRLLRRVPGAQVGDTPGSPAPLRTAPRSWPVGHQPKTRPDEANAGAAAARQETLPTAELILYAGFPLNLMDYYCVQINTTVD